MQTPPQEYLKFFPILLFWLAMSLACLSHAEGIRVSFINPDKPGNPFWDQVNAVMKAAASDLGMQLQIHYAEENRYHATRLTQSLLESSDRPDYLVFMFQHGAGLEMLRMAEHAKVPSLIINTDIPFRFKAEVGAPRQHFKYWIGHLHPDDQAAGKLLITTLALQAAALFKDEKQFSIIGLSGSHDSSAAQRRNLGLHAIVEINSQLGLNQLVFSQWRADLAGQQAIGLMARYPHTRIIWAASDHMALGAAEELQLAGYKPGKELLIGGIDWTPAGLQAIRQGLMSATVGGHFIEGAWAMLLLHDYHHGKDFADFKLEFLSPMQVITPENMHLLEPLLQSGDWREFDFGGLSRVKAGAQGYDFTLDNLLTKKKNAPPIN